MQMKRAVIQMVSKSQDEFIFNVHKFLMSNSVIYEIRYSHFHRNFFLSLNFVAIALQEVAKRLRNL